MKLFKNLFLALIGFSLLLSLGAGSVGAATVLDIGFETSEGYTTGNLYGQNSWDGADLPYIAVGANVAKTGTQSLELNGSGCAATQEDFLSFNSVSGEFIWEFSIHDNDFYNGTDNYLRLYEDKLTYKRLAIYLKIYGLDYNGLRIRYNARNEFGNPWWFDLVQYDDHSWHDIKIIGDTGNDTFDFYFDDGLVSQDCPFLWEVDNIDFIAVGANEGPTSSSYQIYIDDIKLSAVPIPGALWLLGSGLIGIVGIRRKFKN
jgi:hypothetical protein